MNAWKILPLLVGATLASGAGYLGRGLCAREPMRSELSDAIPLDSFVAVRSFSEVETAKGVLEALGQRYRFQVQEKRLEILQSARPVNGGSSEVSPPSFASTIDLLERGIREFAGTPPEWALTRDLLLVLAHEGRHAQWLDLYLATLYRQPTAELVGELAPQAIQMGDRLGRADEVGAAFRHLSRIPFDFAAKQAVSRAQPSVSPGFRTHRRPNAAVHALAALSPNERHP